MEFLLGVGVGVLITYNFLLTNEEYHSKALEINRRIRSLFTSSNKEDK